MIKKGIIFDLDGTLWDSIDSVINSWNSVLINEGYGEFLITRETLTPHIGKPIDQIVAALMPGLSAEENERLRLTCSAHENKYISVHGGKLYPGLISTLKKLSKKYPLYIVSNCQSGYIEAFFAAHQTKEYFQDIECWGNTNLPKSENIKIIVKRNNLAKAVYVGDTLSDMYAAQSAGLPFVWAAYGFGIEAGCGHKIENIGELPKLIGKIL